MLGLHDRQLAASLTVVKIQTAAETKRLTAEGEVLRCDQKSRKYTGNYMLPSASNIEPEKDEEEESNLSEMEEEKEELIVALSELKNRGGNTANQRTGRREATSSTRCYNCGQYGHYHSDCLQRSKSKFTTRQSVRPSAIECQLCTGNHYMRECLQLEKDKQWLSQE